MNQNTIDHSMYTNNSADYDGIMSRMSQRLKWVKGYNKDKKFKLKLKQIKHKPEGFNDH